MNTLLPPEFSPIDEQVENSTNLISTQTRIEGRVFFSEITRFHGILIGEAHTHPGSTLILCESAVVEGNIWADTLYIDGFVRGNISAKTRVTLSRSGRVIGNIQCPSIQVETGAYFEGATQMSPSN